jgi:dCTP deaminase
MQAITDSGLEQLLSSKKIFSHVDGVPLKDFIQPASLDLPIGSVAYVMKSNVIPYGRKISDVVSEYMLDKISLDNGAVLKRGETYFIPVGNCDVPANMNVRISPKSSIGRTDLHVRALVDFYGRMDVINSAKRSQVWLSAIPNSFGGVKVSSGMALSQAMLFIDSDDAKKNNASNNVLLLDHLGLAVPKKYLDDEIIMHLAVPKKDPVAYKARKTTDIVDMTGVQKNTFEDFFEAVYANPDGSFTFEKDAFYIMSTKERIVVPEDVSVEMHPGKHNFGELRIHYAGFFDPGFGFDYKRMLPVGATGVLEVRPHERLTVYDGTPICTLVAYANIEKPLKPYGKDGKNNYANQLGLKVAKYFTEP